MTSTPIIMKNGNSGFLMGFLLGVLGTLGSLITLVGYFLYTEGSLPSINTLTPSIRPVVQVEEMEEEPIVEESEVEPLVTPTPMEVTPTSINPVVIQTPSPNASNLKTFKGAYSCSNGNTGIAQVDMLPSGVGTLMVNNTLVPMSYHLFPTSIGIKVDGIDITSLTWINNTQGFLEGSITIQGVSGCGLSLKEVNQ